MSGISNKADITAILAAEKEKNTLAAICTSSWHLPVYKQTLTYEITQMRKATALEEYIMKAASLKLSYSVDVSMLPSIMGLDDLFFEQAIDTLCQKNIIDKTALPILRLTNEGKVAAELGMLPADAVTENIEYYIDRKFAAVYASICEDSQCGVHPKYELIDKTVENAKKYINRKFLVEAGKTVGKEIEDSKAGKRITSIVSAKTTDAAKTLFTEIYLYDMSKGDIVRKIWDHAKGAFRDDWAHLMDDNGIGIAPAPRLIPPGELAKDIPALAAAGKSDSDTAKKLKICRGSEKDSLMEKIISSASQQIIVSMPMLTAEGIEKTGDSLVKKALSKVKVMLIYGTASGRDAKEALDSLCQKVAKLTEDNEEFTFDIIQSSECPVAETVCDGKVCAVSDIVWARCEEPFALCADAAYFVTDEDTVKNHREYWESVCCR